MNLTEILRAANVQRKAVDESLKTGNLYAASQHCNAYWALRARADRFKMDPDPTPVGTPRGAREVVFEETNLVAKAA